MAVFSVQVQPGEQGGGWDEVRLSVGIKSSAHTDKRPSLLSTLEPSHNTLDLS